MTLEAAVERAPADAEHLRRLHAIPFDLPEDVEDVLTLDRIERRRSDVLALRRIDRTGPASRPRNVRSERAREFAFRDRPALGEHARPLDDVLQLADVAVPT